MTTVEPFRTFEDQVAGWHRVIIIRESDKRRWMLKDQSLEAVRVKAAEFIEGMKARLHDA